MIDEHGIKVRAILKRAYEAGVEFDLTETGISMQAAKRPPASLRRALDGITDDIEWMLRVGDDDCDCENCRQFKTVH